MINNSKISGVSSKLVTQLARAKSALIAAVAATSLTAAASSFGVIQPTTITAFTATTTTGTSTTIDNVTGYGASYSPFLSTNTYTMHYLGEDEALTSVTAGSLGTYKVTGQATVTLRTVPATGGSNPADNNDSETIWYQGSGTGANHSTITLDGPYVNGVDALAEAFTGNNLLMGGDNVFSNQGNPVGDNTNVKRIDITFSSPVTASTSTAVSVFDRGPSDDHDAFAFAAITAESGGVPTAYGPLFTESDGTWGQTALVNSTQEDITRESDAVTNDTMHPSDSTSQSIGGILIPTDTMVPAGTTIYGYSLFSGNVGSMTPTPNSAQLVDYSALPAGDSTSSGGGLDPATVLGNVYTLAPVPEPTTGALLVVALGGLSARRNRRKLAE